MDIFLTTFDFLSDVKKEMLKDIKNISYDRKRYSWANHVIDLLKANYEICQELGK